MWQGKLKEEGFEIHRLRRNREQRIDPDTLLNSTKYPNIYFLKPSSDFLKITYKNERDESGYQAMLKAMELYGDDSISNKYRLDKRFSKQVTSIEIPDTLFCTISEDLVVIPVPPITHGYWSKDTTPKWLPANYKPPILKK